MRSTSCCCSVKRGAVNEKDMLLFVPCCLMKRLVRCKNFQKPVLCSSSGSFFSLVVVLVPLVLYGFRRTCGGVDTHRYTQIHTHTQIPTAPPFGSVLPTTTAAERFRPQQHAFPSLLVVTPLFGNYPNPNGPGWMVSCSPLRNTRRIRIEMLKQPTMIRCNKIAPSQQRHPCEQMERAVHAGCLLLRAS